MSVRIDLADVREVVLRSCGERGLGLRHSAFGSTHKSASEGRTQDILGLMLEKNGIPYSVAHAQNGERQAANQQQLAGSAQLWSSRCAVKLARIAPDSNEHRYKRNNHAQTARISDSSRHQPPAQF